MKLFISPNTYGNEQKKIAKAVVTKLEKQCGCECVLSLEESTEIFKNEDRAGSPADCDYIVSVGGDGAVLRAAKTAVTYKKPLIGINAGRLGYLCALDTETLDSINSDTFSKLSVSERIVLSADYDGREMLALNDVVIAKENFGATVSLSVMRDGEEILSSRGDGVIISTPTGSTSYSLSAGGPELDSELDCILITPICPHFEKVHPIVVKGDSVLVIGAENLEKNKAIILTDGEEIGKMGHKLVITRNKTKLKLLTKDEKKN